MMATDQTKPPIRNEILVALRRIIRAIDLYSRQLMEQYGLTGPQLAALHEIAPSKNLSATQLASLLQVSQPTMTGILERLEKRGLVRKVRSATDRRNLEISLTDAGGAMLSNAPPLLQERFCQELSKLADWEQNMLLANLQRIAAMMHARDLDAAPHLVSGADIL